MNLEPADNATGTASALHQALVDEIKAKGVLHTPRVEAAFRAVPRHLFVPEVPLEEVYRDQHLVTKRRDGQVISTSSQPLMMAIMLEQLALEPGHKVLEIGTGTGYNAALMDHIVGARGQVISIDIDEDIIEEAHDHLAAANHGKVRVICADGGHGYSEAAPYDRIIVTAGTSEILPAWYQQLNVGGRLVVPITIRGGQFSIAFKKVDDHLESRALQFSQFVPLRGEFAAHATKSTQGDPDRGFTLQLLDEPSIDVESIYQWLNGTGQYWDVAVQVSLQEASSNLGLWLMFRVPGWGLITLTGDLADAEIATPFVRMGGAEKSSTIGILLDQEGLALLGRSSGEVVPTISPNASFASNPSFNLQVSQFGPNELAAHRLVQQIRLWDRTGRPSMDNIWIHAYPRDVTFTLPDDATLIEKEWTLLVVGWRQPR